MGIMAIYIIIAFGAEYAEIKGINKTTGAVGAFFAFMLLNYNSVGQLVVTAKDGTLSAGASAFESTYWGGAGLITAMIAGAIAINIIDICYKNISLLNYQILYHQQSLTVSQLLFLTSLLH